jgi:uncharacterized protein YvpB
MKGKFVAAAVVVFVALLIVFAATGGVSPAEPTATEPPTEAATEAKAEPVILDAPYISQNEGYPTGCEAISAVMALNNAGVTITPNEFIDDYLPQGLEPEYSYEYGTYVGDSPQEYFLGNPYSEDGIGCYSQVIVQSLEKIIRDKNASLKIESGYIGTLEELCDTYIDSGTPVIVWATMEMKTAQEGMTWLTSDGGEFTWVGPEHCLLLVGYDDDNYYFNDPQKGRATAYPREKCETAYTALGCQSIALVK